MPIYKIKDYKIINGIQAKKSKEDFFKQTCNGKKIWFYKCNYTDIYGEKCIKRSKQYATKEEATKEEIRFLSSLGENKNNNTKITFDDVYEEYMTKLSNEVRPQTLKKNVNYYKHIGPYLGKISVDKLSLEQVNKWQYEINNKNLKCSYKNKIFNFVKALMRYAHIYYKINNNVLELVGNFKNPNEIKEEMLFFTEEEFKKYISVVDDVLWKAVFETLFYCGIRQGELQALNWNDINFEDNTININKTLTTKLKDQAYTIFPPKTKSSYRIIPITNSLKEDLNNLYNIYSNLDGFNKNWFVFGGIKPLSETTIQNHKNKYCKQANVKQIRIHDFRHSCASLLISKNADPVLVAKYLGHSDVSMTLNRYSHMYKSKLNEIIKLIEN